MLHTAALTILIASTPMSVSLGEGTLEPEELLIYLYKVIVAFQAGAAHVFIGRCEWGKVINTVPYRYT